jgi:hypothetical protein
MALDIEQIKSFQVGNKTITQSTITVIPGINPTTGSNNLQKTIQDISQLTLKSNEISSFLSEANLDGGNKPFSILEFAKNLVTKQEEQPQTENSQITDPNPLAKKLKQQQKRLISSIVQNYIKSGKLLTILEKNLNKILSQSNVNYVSVENGQIVAQPIQNQQVDQAIKNIQETVNTYVKAVDKYARRVYNTDPILSLEQFKNNLSLNKLVDIIDKVIAIKADLLLAKIKVRKARDLTTAANAAAQVPVPNLSLAAEYTERATQYTADELKQMQDLYAAGLIITELKKQIDFYGTKYEKTKNQLLNIQQTINVFQSQLINKALTQVNNQLTGSYNELTGSIVTRISNTTGSTTTSI